MAAFLPRSSGTVGSSPDPFALDTCSAPRNDPSVVSATRVSPKPGDLQVVVRQGSIKIWQNKNKGVVRTGKTVQKYLPLTFNHNCKE